MEVLGVIAPVALFVVPLLIWLANRRHPARRGQATLLAFVMALAVVVGVEWGKVMLSARHAAELPVIGPGDR
ncbi:MAG: hypothetical protein HONBIEJF_00004 [Fimbriimonadaceae bacterium]|nr:hypothetical protein [Fimbriimonadaceae bacterium]